MKSFLLAPFVFVAAAAAPLAAQAAEASAPTKSQAQLEAEFAELLTNCRLVGYFTSRDMPEGQTLQEDAYQINKATKQEDGQWRIEAVIEYGEAKFPFAMAVPVEWAGDTPMITLTDFQVPMMGKFSARVLFYADEYAGIWIGTDTHRGQMFGRIERVEAESEGAGMSPESEEGAMVPDTGQDAVAASASGEAVARADETASWDEKRVDPGKQWPSFHGWRAAGVSDGFASPIEWDVASGKNVAWRTKVPGLAHSSPVIWDDRLFVTTAVREEGEGELTVGLYGSINPVEDEGPHTFDLFCLDKESGKILWSQTAWAGVPQDKRHPKGSFAASSPATDGEHVVAFYGSEGLYCYDVEGNLLWEKNFGRLDSGYFMVKSAEWGFSSSPVIHGDHVIVQCDVQDQSFIAALRLADGEEVWRTDREEVPTWSTPTIDVREGRSQVICNGWKEIAGYDLRTGERLWRLTGGGDIPVPAPVVSHDTIFITNAHGQLAPIYAIAAMAKGDVTAGQPGERYMLWKHDRRGNYMQTPFVYGEELYCCNDAGILAAYDVTTGEEIYRERLGEGRTGFTSSGVASDGKLYFASEEGDVHVVQAGPDFEVLSVNPLGEECMATPAVSEGKLYYRTRGHVVAVGE